MLASCRRAGARGAEGGAEKRPRSSGIARPRVRNRGRHGLSQRPQVERLAQYAEESLADEDVIGRDEDDWHGDAGPTQCNEDVRPGEARHDHVDEDDLRLEGRHRVERFAAILHRGYQVALAGKEVAEQLTDLRLIIGDEHPGTRGLQRCRDVPGARGRLPSIWLDGHHASTYRYRVASRCTTVTAPREACPSHHVPLITPCGRRRSSSTAASSPSEQPLQKLGERCRAHRLHDVSVEAGCFGPGAILWLAIARQGDEPGALAQPLT